MKRPSILEVTAYYPPRLGGQGNTVRGLATQLIIRGYDVQVVTSDRGSTSGQVVESGVRVTRLGGIEFAHTAFIWGLPAWLLRHTDKNTLVHLHIGQAFTPEVVWLASKIKGFKYIAHIHTDAGSSGFAGKLLPLYKKIFLGFVLRHADRVIALSESYRKLLIKKYRVKEDRIAVIPNGVDERFFNDKLKTKQKESFRLLYVGRLTIEKNVSMIIEAVGKTKAPIQLDIVGDGPLLDELKRQIQQVKNQKIIFYGKKSADELVKFYQVADALVLASDYEGQPTVIMEAMASGTPVVGTNVMGIRDTIGSSGILVEKNATALSRAITKLSSDLTLRKALAEKARKKAEEFRWEKSIQKLKKVYAEL